MKERGRNILPMIGFIMLLVLFLGGLTITGIRNAGGLPDDGNSTASAETETNESVFGSGSNWLTLNRYTVDDSKELSADGIDKLTIVSVSSELNIYYDNTNKIKAKYYGSVQSSEKEKVPYLEVVKDGREAIVRIKYPLGNNVTKSEQTALDVTIPEKLACDLEIRNTSGNITAKELKGGNISVNTVSGAISPGAVKGENIEIKSTSGAINVNNVDASGKFIFETISGKCTVSSINCKKADLKSTSGSIDFNDAAIEEISARSISGSLNLVVKQGSADIETTSGKINVKFIEGFDNINAKSISGKVAISIPENSQFEADIQTLSGKIDCSDFSMQIKSSRPNELKATAGNGSSKIKINTTSGNVEIIKN